MNTWHVLTARRLSIVQIVQNFASNCIVLAYLLQCFWGDTYQFVRRYKTIIVKTNSPNACTCFARLSFSRLLFIPEIICLTDCFRFNLINHRSFLAGLTNTPKFLAKASFNIKLIISCTVVRKLSIFPQSYK